MSGGWQIDLYFNPRSPCGERPGTETMLPGNWRFQSTLPVWGATGLDILIHPLRNRFQSTLPVWGATLYHGHHGALPQISIHAPRVGSDKVLPEFVQALRRISIHAPRVGSDTPESSQVPVYKLFQSTLPVWGATNSFSGNSGALKISIHAPRVGSDRRRRVRLPPCCIFQSTLPVWGATTQEIGMPPLG